MVQIIKRMVSRVKTLSKNLSDQFPVLYQNRYCDQEEFSIGLFSNNYYNEDFSIFKLYLLNNFDTKTYVPSLSKPKYGCKAVSIGSDIYVLGQNKDHNSLSFEKYSSSTKSWKTLPLLNTLEEELYYMCSFMQKVFIITEKHSDTPSMFYDDQTNQWTSITSCVRNMEEAATTVFEGKLILSGGLRKKSRIDRSGRATRIFHQQTKLKSIEAYDFHENKWSYLPSMLSTRVNHSSVSISNKMFMIGGSSDYSEVFDSVTRKFTFIKIFPKWVGPSELLSRNYKPFQVVNIGYKMFFFQKDDKKVNIHSYNVRNNRFCYKTSIEMESFKNIGCIKVPMI